MVYWLIRDNLDSTYTPIKSMDTLFDIDGENELIVMGEDIMPNQAKVIDESGKLSVVMDDDLNKILDEAAQGRIARQLCEDILDMIAGFNIQNSVSTTEIAQMKIDWALAFEYLKDNQPWGFKATLDLIDVTGTPITSDFIDRINKRISQSGLSGL